MKPLLFALASTLAVSACAVGPDYVRPDLHAPAAFHATAPAASSAPVASLERWWDAFQDPTLSRLIAVAVSQNLSLEQAKARVQLSRAGLGAATAELLPSGSVAASAARAKQSTETPLGRVLASQPGFDRFGNAYEGDLVAGWELDLFGGLRRGREGAVDDLEAAQAGYAAATLEVQAQVADDYLAIRGLQQRLAVAREQVDTQTRLTHTIRLQFEAGIAPALQLHQAEGALSQVEATVPALESALASAMNALDVMLARQPGESQVELAAIEPIPQAPSLADAGGPADLLRRRPDLIAAERQLAASNARIGQAIAEYYPKFSLSALIGTATTTAGQQFSGPANQAQGVLGLRWRLFDFGRVDAEIKAARARDAEALATYRLSVLRASEDVEDALVALDKRQQEATILAGGEVSLQQAEIASEAAYKGGAVSLIEVLDANSRLLATRDAKVQAQAGSARTAVAAFRALGGGWDPQNGVASVASP
ncbi:RND transporter [Luteibacter rhizovicinus DSM 16549]|uniref:RND transporter n=1 Tax=Luteibacter rhizovicinus DSM 16549 TaxID=1440763 RepID=A0A0G9HCL3_9GAMM|nr:efflux transporter outer membrane subunit [Luteibacter rhizovicinus]APG05834.1 RND transporter [Luteibacter rhizovicinus DSM 16549]KLD67216.1 RND transporter [Luteibacter rhizovicinus DSM 16549]KLD73305.1 RND transporter [Xanthomonas hyacinthi DSM 19077]